jgi:hypothetical protein
MAIENLPRPWLLAALTGLKVAELLGPEAPQRPERPPQRSLPRPESRRRRLGAHGAAHADGCWRQAGGRFAPIASSSRA